MTVGELIKKLEVFDDKLFVCVAHNSTVDSRREIFDAQLIEGDVVIVSDEE